MGKCIVITGAGGVLCSCFARALAADGHKIALVNRTYEKAARVQREIAASGGAAKAYAANVLDKDALQKVRDAIVKDFGPCDALVNGAGGNHPSCTTDREFLEADDSPAREGLNFFSLSQDGFARVFELNVQGTVLPTQVFSADMTGRKGCCVVNISSMAAFRPLTKTPAYAAAKAAVSNFTAWLAVHFAPMGIRVNAIAPGFFMTEQNRHLLFSKDGAPAPRTGKILRHTPMGRFGAPEELVGTLRWLIDDNASGFVTGTVIPVDGGFSAYSGV